MSGFATINGVNRSLGDGWATINGVCRKIKGGWETKNGVWQEILSSGLPISNLPVGSLIKLSENGSAANYRIVHQGLPSGMYDASCNGTWVLRETIHSNRVWDSSNNDYQNSDIHAYLNGTFLGLFDSGTQAAIKQIKIPYVNGTGGAAVASGANGLSTKIFLLGGYEVGWTTSMYTDVAEDSACLSYFSGTSKIDTKRVGYLNGSATYWWLRSVTSGNTRAASMVNAAGGYNGGICTDSRGIRPAMVLDGLVNPTPNADGSYTLLV